MAVITPPALTDTPEFPALSDRAAGTYNSKAYAFGTHMANVFNAELAALAANVEHNANEAAYSAVATAADVITASGHVSAASGHALDASLSAAAAAESEDNALASAVAAELSNVQASKLNLGAKATAPTLDNQGEALLQGAIYFDTTLGKWRVWTGALWVDGVSTIAGVSSFNGLTGDIVYTGDNIYRSARTSNTMLAAADKGKLIDITSGSFTQTFDAAATLGDGWWCRIRNSGTGDITLDPDGAETIDGLANFVMYPGEVRLVQCDGVELRSIVLNSFYKVFETSGTLTVPPGYRWLDTLTWGGGNSGQKTGSASNALGGGGGGCFPATIPVEILGASVAITVGAGGAARTGSQTGAKGGASSIGSFVVVCMFSGTSAPENGGAVTAAGTAPMEPEGESNAAFGRSPAGPNNQSVYGGTSAAITGAGAKAVYGAGCGGSTNGATAYAGGTSIFGGNGGAAGDAVSGVDGSIPGGGGGGTRTGSRSGAGARGEVRIWGVI